MTNEFADIAEAHRAGIDLSYRAPDLPAAIRDLVPEPVIEGQPDWLELYWRTWSIAFDQVRKPTPESGLVTYCDAAFSHNIFQWDTCFMERFLRYAPEPFYAYGSLDNFYIKQHADGYICREINAITGADFWERTHSSSINPPLFADSEWSLYRVTGDKARLAKVLPQLHRYHQWLNENRRAQDGAGFWTTALGSGMDNSPRAYEQGGEDVHKPYGYVWMCMTAQQALAARRIGQIASVCGDEDLARQYEIQFQALSAYVHERLWNGDLGCYADLAPDGTVTDVLTPAMCWPLLLDDCPTGRTGRIAELLADPKHFWRQHAIPSLSADHERYNSRGHYWCGSVWPPMVDLAVRAMQASDHHELATAIAANHLENINAVYRATGTFWENYAPDSTESGEISRPEFVGWTGCGPIALLIEAILGFEVSAPERTVTWRMTRTDRHGIKNLPMADNRITLIFEPSDRTLTVDARERFDLRLILGENRLDLTNVQGKKTITLP